MTIMLHAAIITTPSKADSLDKMDAKRFLETILNAWVEVFFLIKVHQRDPWCNLILLRETLKKSSQTDTCLR